MADIKIQVSRTNEDKVNFWAKEKNKQKVIEDLLIRYRNIINENIKKGKTLEEKKQIYRKYIEKYSNDNKAYNATVKMTNAVLQDLQHSRYYDIECDGSRWSHNNPIEINFDTDSMTITDVKDGWKMISEEAEQKASKERIKQVMDIIKEEDKKKWAIIQSIDHVHYLYGDREKPIELTISTYGNKETTIRVNTNEVQFMDIKQIKRKIDEEYINFETKLRGHRIKEIAKIKYKEEFGKNW